MVFRSHGHLPLYISYFWRSTLNSPKQADTAPWFLATYLHLSNNHTGFAYNPEPCQNLL
jgi:hypothetical protein